MFYTIVGFDPQHGMGMAGFGIKLHKGFDSMVANSEYLNQESVNKAIETQGRRWLDGCGFDDLYDPGNPRWGFGEKKKPSKNARPLYEPGQSLSVTWGKWGPEHIDVPGNACGLDIYDGAPMKPRNGAYLAPHNVDTPNQARLLLTVFLFFAESLTLSWEIKEMEKQSD